MIAKHRFNKDKNKWTRANTVDLMTGRSLHKNRSIFNDANFSPTFQTPVLFVLYSNWPIVYHDYALQFRMNSNSALDVRSWNFQLTLLDFLWRILVWKWDKPSIPFFNLIKYYFLSKDMSTPESFNCNSKITHFHSRG